LIEAVLFDGDQTLWDFQKVMRSALLAVLADIRVARPGPTADALRVSDLQSDRNAVAKELLGVEFNLARLRNLGFTRSLARLRHSDEGPFDLDPTAVDDAALAQELTTAYFRYRDHDPALFDDTLPCLNALKADYRIGLLSNGSRLPEAIGLGGVFESVVFAQDHNVTKPDRGIFEVVEREVRIEPSACVLVGDHPLNDVVGAKQSGWRAIWIDRDGDGSWRPAPGHADKPDAIVTSLDQIPEVLKSL
jgi:putative hydrolase of the HAD superfamily